MTCEQCGDAILDHEDRWVPDAPKDTRRWHLPCIWEEELAFVKLEERD